MAKTRKILTKIITALIIVVIIIMLMVTLLGDRALKTGIETVATKTLNVGVTLEDVDLSILGGSLELDNLVVNNPPDYQHPELLKLGSAAVDVQVGSLLSDTVNISKINLDDITLVIEQKGLTNNLKQILDSLPKAEPETKEPKPEPSGKKLHITELVISNVNVKVKLLPVPGKADTISLKLDPIIMKDLGSDDKLDMAKLTAKVLGAIATGVAKQGAGLLPDDIVGPLSDTLKKSGQMLLETGTEVLDKTKDAGKELIEGGKDIGEGAADAIKGLFKSKDK